MKRSADTQDSARKSLYRWVAFIPRQQRTLHFSTPTSLSLSFFVFSSCTLILENFINIWGFGRAYFQWTTSNSPSFNSTLMVRIDWSGWRPRAVYVLMPSINSDVVVAMLHCDLNTPTEIHRHFITRHRQAFRTN